MAAPGLDWRAEEDGSEHAALGHLHLYTWREGDQWYAQVEDAASVLWVMRGFADAEAAGLACRFYARGYLDRDALVSVIHAEAFIVARERLASCCPLDDHAFTTAAPPGVAQPTLFDAPPATDGRRPMGVFRKEKK